MSPTPHGAANKTTDAAAAPAGEKRRSGGKARIARKEIAKGDAKTPRKLGKVTNLSIPLESKKSKKVVHRPELTHGQESLLCNICMGLNTNYIWSRTISARLVTEATASLCKDTGINFDESRVRAAIVRFRVQAKALQKLKAACSKIRNNSRLRGVKEVKPRGPTEPAGSKRGCQRTGSRRAKSIMNTSDMAGEAKKEPNQTERPPPAPVRPLPPTP